MFLHILFFIPGIDKVSIIQAKIYGKSLINENDSLPFYKNVL